MESKGHWKRHAAWIAIPAIVALSVAGGVCGAARNTGKPNALADSQALLGKPGGTGLIRADEVTYDTTTKVMTATGHVEIDYNGRILLADKVTYDQVKDVATADGHVSVLEPNGTVAFADHAVLTDKMRDGVAEGFSALIGKHGRFAAIHATRTANGTILTGFHGVFSSCKVCNQPGQRTPLWQVRADRIVWNQVEHEIVYHDAVFELFGVPVGYTPYFSQPDPSVKHKTGLLAPELGSSSVLGYLARVPVYVAFSDSEDATISPMFTSKAGVLLEGEYRERWDNGGMWFQGAVAYNPNAVTGNQQQVNGALVPDEHVWNSSLFGSGRIPLADNVWKLGFDAQLTSNNTFLKRYELSILDRLTSDLFIEGLDGRSRFAITGYFFQGLRLTDNEHFFPIVLPFIEYTLIPEHKILGGDLRLDANTVSVTRDLGPQSQRATAEVRWSLPLLTDNGQMITIQADARGDVFRVTNNDLPDFPDVPTKVHYIARGLPYVALDWRWPFAASKTLFGGTSFVIEPVAQAILAPYGDNPKGIPNEDSGDFELDDNNIFNFQHLPGYDLVETGPRANAGFRATAFFPGGGSTELLVGEAFRLKPDSSFDQLVGINDNFSNIVARFTIKFPPHFSLTHRVEIDQTTGNLQRNEVYLDATWGRSVLEVSYLKLSQEQAQLGLEPREEVNGQATVGLFDHWAVFAGARRDLEHDQMIDDEIGIGYLDECLGISISYRRDYTTDQDVPPSTSVLFRVRLNTSDQSEEPSVMFPRHVFTTP
ncbi:MAG TPA: LPS assembly protein LptD [Rhizomicrobium sp.]